MSAKDHPGAEYEPDLGPQTHLDVKIPTHQLGKIATLLDLTVKEAVLHFEEDALRVTAHDPSDIKRVWIEETSIEYQTDHHEFSVGVDTEQFRRNALISRPDETTRLSFTADEDDATVHSGNLMGWLPLLDPLEVEDPGADPIDFEWTYEATVQAKHLKQAIAGVVDCSGRAFHLLGYGELGVRGKDPQTGEFDRYEPVDTENNPDGLGHAFLAIESMSPVIDALPLDETVTVHLGEWMPVRIETESGTTIDMAPYTSREDYEAHLKAILTGVGIDA